MSQSFANCVDNSEYLASLELHKTYQPSIHFHNLRANRAEA